MTIPLSGQVFEAAVLRAMRLIPGCTVFTSEELDFECKIDVVIKVAQGVRLERPVQVQLTTRLDHFGKIRRYLDTRERDRTAVSLYVEVEPDATSQAEKIALELMQVARDVQTRPWGRRWPLFGLRIGPHESAYFDPFKKFRALRKERNSPERKRALRKGVAHDFLEYQFTISGEDGGTYVADFIDVDGSVFRSRLRDSIWQADASFMVWFLPSGNFAHDVRQRYPSSRKDSS